MNCFTLIFGLSGVLCFPQGLKADDLPPRQMAFELAVITAGDDVLALSLSMSSGAFAGASTLTAPGRASTKAVASPFPFDPDDERLTDSRFVSLVGGDR